LNNIETFSKYSIRNLSDNLKDYLEWIMRYPGGLKLNDDLIKFLCTITISSINWWTGIYKNKILRNLLFNNLDAWGLV
jgi:hypothetical protein